MAHHPVVRAHIGLLTYATLVSTAYPIASYLGSNYSPLLTTWGRFVVAALGFVALMLFKGQFSLPSIRTLGRYSLISFPLTGFFLLMFVAGETASSLAMGSLSTIIPLFSFLFAWLLWRQPFHFKRLAILSMGVTGALWVLTGGNFQLLIAEPWPIGNNLFIVACMLMGLYPLVLHSLHRGESMLTITGWSLITGVGWLSLGLLVLQPTLALPNVPQLAAIVWLAIATTMFTFYLFQTASMVVGGSSANAYNLLSPVLVLIITLFQGAPIPSLWILPGVAMIGLTLWMLMRQDKR